MLAGDIVVGAGNIYACEALFRAGIDPRTRCHRLSLARCERLLVALREVLSRGGRRSAARRCATFAMRTAAPASSRLNARVYGRAGQPCVQCGTPVRRVVQAQRSTFFCPRCQTR